MERIVINISDFSSEAFFVDEECGKRARVYFQLDEIDKGTQSVVVRFPDNTSCLTASFFLGMFAKSVHASGDSVRFLRRFTIVIPARVRSMIAVYTNLAEALIKRQPDKRSIVARWSMFNRWANSPG
jgi:hypothetical protein